MTIDGPGPDDEQSTTQQAKAETAEVAATAKEGAQEVAGAAAEQAQAVADEARAQVQRVVSQAGDELRARGEEQSQRAASGLRTLSDQVGALRAGRPEEAGPLERYLDEAQAKAQQFAERLESGGPQGVIDDLTSFARRRPGLFLLGATGLGFGVGRLARSAAAANSDQTPTSDDVSLPAPTPPVLDAPPETLLAGPQT